LILQKCTRTSAATANYSLNSSACFYRTMLADIRTALTDADSVTVERMAHTFKGTAGNLCASEVALTAGRLEAVGRLNALHDAPPVYAQLELEVARLVRVLESYRQGYQPITQAAA
jgi:two-component system, sensor histidine kinase and response regulator